MVLPVKGPTAKMSLLSGAERIASRWHLVVKVLDTESRPTYEVSGQLVRQHFSCGLFPSEVQPQHLTRISSSQHESLLGMQCFAEAHSNTVTDLIVTPAWVPAAVMQNAASNQPNRPRQEWSPSSSFPSPSHPGFAQFAQSLLAPDNDL